MLLLSVSNSSSSYCHYRHSLLWDSLFREHVLLMVIERYMGLEWGMRHHRGNMRNTMRKVPKKADIRHKYEGSIVVLRDTGKNVKNILTISLMGL